MAPPSISARAAGWSIREASASPATAIRAPRGWSWTPMSGRRATTGSSTTSTWRRKRSPTRDCPSTSATASTSVSRLRPVARLALPILALALGAAVAVGLVSCGTRDEKGLLPGNNARQILDNLDQVKADAQSGNCSSAALEVATVKDEIDALPTTVDAQLRARLSDGAQRLADVVNSPGACETT